MNNRRRMLISAASALPAKNTLQNTSWLDIAEVAASGKAAEYWAVGDTKTITFGSAVLGSTSIVVKIMDFSYDDFADGSGKAPITFGMVDCFATTRTMNAANTNEGGWGGCALRATLINDVLPALQAVTGSGVIKPVSKRTSAGNTSYSITISTDSVWLFSEYEVFGTYTYSRSGEKLADKNICYPAFTDSASRVKRIGTDAANWFERSPYGGDNQNFCAVNSVGTAGIASASVLRGVAVGFCV